MANIVLGIIGNKKKQLAVDTAKRAMELLEKNRVGFFVDSGFLQCKQSKLLKQISADLFLVFGGDGTMLYAVRELKKQVPLLGINCGTRGHLLSVSPENIENAVGKILRSEFFVENRSRLQILIDGKLAPLALNEVIVAPKKSFTLFDFQLSIGKQVHSSCSDAVAVVTPTGSTAFALAAGGKQLGIAEKVFEILPVHPCSGIVNPLFVSDEEKITIVLPKKPVGCEAIIDGQKRISIKKNIVVEKSSENALFASLR